MREFIVDIHQQIFAGYAMVQAGPFEQWVKEVLISVLVPEVSRFPLLTSVRY